MKLTDNGKCPIDLVKPLTYKRENVYYCTRCSRTFRLDNGDWVTNSAWMKPHTMHGAAGVVAARDTPGHNHMWIEVEDNASFNCIGCHVGINTVEWLSEHTPEGDLHE